MLIIKPIIVLKEQKSDTKCFTIEAAKRFKIQNGRNGDTKRLTEFEKWFNLSFFYLSSQNLLNKFFDASSHSMRKGCDGNEKKQAEAELGQAQA